MIGQRLALQWWTILASVIICGGCEVPDKPAAPKFIGHEGEEVKAAFSKGKKPCQKGASSRQRAFFCC